MANKLIDSLKIKGVMYDIGVSGVGLKTIVVEARQVTVFREAEQVPTISGGKYNFDSETLTTPQDWYTTMENFTGNKKVWISIGFVQANTSTIAWSTPVEFVTYKHIKELADQGQKISNLESAQSVLSKAVADLQSRMTACENEVKKIAGLQTSIQNLETALGDFNNITIEGDEVNTALKITTTK